MARPQIQIDKEMFERFCAEYNSEETIARYFNCSVDTIERWCKRTYNGQTFEQVYARYKAHGATNLRHYLMKQAEKNTLALIFACKNYLGMTDKPKEDMSQQVSEALAALLELQKKGAKGIDELE